VGELDVTVSSVPDLPCHLNGVLQANADYLSFDRPSGKLQRHRAKQTWERAWNIPAADIDHIEVGPITEEHCQRDGWRATTHFLHGAKHTPARTGVLVILKNGQHLFFVAIGRAPIEVRSELYDLPQIQ
jgi:hypothetical protein